MNKLKVLVIGTSEVGLSATIAKLEHQGHSVTVMQREDLSPEQLTQVDMQPKAVFPIHNHYELDQVKLAKAAVIERTLKPAEWYHNHHRKGKSWKRY